MEITQIARPCGHWPTYNVGAASGNLGAGRSSRISSQARRAGRRVRSGEVGCVNVSILLCHIALNLFCFALSVPILRSTISKDDVSAVQHQLYRRSLSASILSLQHRLVYRVCLQDIFVCYDTIQKGEFYISVTLLCVSGVLYSHDQQFMPCDA